MTVRDTGVGIPASRTAAPVRALPPGRRPEGPHPLRAPASVWRWSRSWSGFTAGRSVRKRDRQRHAFIVSLPLRSRPSASRRGSAAGRPSCIDLAAGRGLTSRKRCAGCPNPSRSAEVNLRIERPSHLICNSAPRPAEPDVLLVDDNADMRSLHQPAARGAVERRSGPDGEAALDAIRARKPDLVLSDVMMPGLDGFGLLRELRSDPDLRDLPVIVVSAQRRRRGARGRPRRRRRRLPHQAFLGARVDRAGQCESRDGAHTA